MKGLKFMIAAALLAATTSASAQFEDTTEPTKDAPKAPTYSLMAKRPIHEISLYMQDGWGLGYQLRKDINRYIAWNIIGASYMVGRPIDQDPSNEGLVNLRLFGVRLNSPSFNKCRIYTELNLGYSIGYSHLLRKKQKLPVIIKKDEFLNQYDNKDEYKYLFDIYHYHDSKDGYLWLLDKKDEPIYKEVNEENIPYWYGNFGLDFGVGFQLGKHFTIGYNLNFIKDNKKNYSPSNYYFDCSRMEHNEYKLITEIKRYQNNNNISHWVKISCLF